jgi:hypothetical protein
MLQETEAPPFGAVESTPQQSGFIRLGSRMESRSVSRL